MTARRRFLFVTPEYPPGCGGVGDYTRLVARALAGAGDHVSVWTRPSSHLPFVEDGFPVHPLPDDFGRRTMRELDRAFRELPPKGVAVVEYVPQGFGWKGTNVPFAAWLGARTERVWLMVHEPLYPFLRGQPLRHDVLAAVTRLMLRLATRRSEHVFVSTPAWESYVTRWGRPGLRPEWLPIPATMGTSGAPARSNGSSTENVAPTVTHFGTYGELVAKPLTRVLVSLLERNPELHIALVGRGSERFLNELAASAPGARARLRATGPAEPDAIREELRHATVALFPFQEGASSRRTSLMSALSAGAAIVTTEGWCSESVWRESDAVELSDPNDPSSTVGAVERLLSDPTRRTDLRRRAVELYERRFHVDRVAARLRELADDPNVGRASS